MNGPSAGETVQGAARATLAAGRARLRTLWAEEIAAEHFWIGSEGVVDLEQRLSRREELCTAVEAAGRSGDDLPYVTYEQGTTVVFGHEGDWLRLDRDRRSLRDPTLIFELLAERPLVDVASDGEERIRDAMCSRYGGRLDVREAGLSRDEERAGPLFVKVWVETGGRITRVAWRFPRVGRPRSPLRPRGGMLWRTIELWDFGVPVDVQLPPAEPPSASSLRGRWRLKAAEIRGG
jgi:hypothetical protein